MYIGKKYWRVVEFRNADRERVLKLLEPYPFSYIDGYQMTDEKGQERMAVKVLVTFDELMEITKIMKSSGFLC